MLGYIQSLMAFYDFKKSMRWSSNYLMSVLYLLIVDTRLMRAKYSYFILFCTFSDSFLFSMCCYQTPILYFSIVKSPNMNYNWNSLAFENTSVSFLRQKRFLPPKYLSSPMFMDWVNLVLIIFLWYVWPVNKFSPKKGRTGLWLANSFKTTDGFQKHI